MSWPGQFAHLFDAQYQDFDADLPFWLERAGRSGNPVLELGCGSGRVLKALVQAGIRVVGVDHDPEMLELARSRLAGVDSESARLVQAGLTEFELGARFKLALAPLNTLATLGDDDLLACLERTADHTDPGAAFICDLPNPATALEPESDPDEILDAFIEPISGSAVQVKAAIERLAKNRAQVTWVYEILSPQGQIESYPYEQVFYLRDVEQLQALGKATGMELVEVLGDYEGNAFSTDSPRLLTVFRRNA
jgi:SAM-dependent methyltransferase